MQLCALIAIKRHAELGGLEITESKPERLDSFGIGEKHYKMATFSVQTFYLCVFLARPRQRVLFVDLYRECRRIVRSTWRNRAKAIAFIFSPKFIGIIRANNGHLAKVAGRRSGC
jgi:hypothetical protein